MALSPFARHRSEGEEAAALVTSLFALWHQGNRIHQRRPNGTLGGSFKELADAERRRGGKSPREPVPNVERRFAVLLDSHAEDLPERLRHAMSLLKAQDVPIDWTQLLDDLLRWDWPERLVQRSWARDYWTGSCEDDSSPPDALVRS